MTTQTPDDGHRPPDLRRRRRARPDFDDADPADGFTTTMLPDGGALVRTTDIYVSEPASFTSAGDGTITWTKGGASPFIQVEANLPRAARAGRAEHDGSRAPLRPRGHGRRPDRASLREGRGPRRLGLPGLLRRHRDVRGRVHHGGAPADDGADPADVWTDIRLVWSSTGAFSVSYNGVTILNDMAPFGVTSTSISATLGPVRVGVAPQMSRHAFDNLRVSVRR